MFDNVASKYDQGFTYSAIGSLLRKQVHLYLDSILPADKPLNILEINCGTGEDAIYLAKKGHKLMACDISEEMIRVARFKAKSINSMGEINFNVCDTRNLSAIEHPLLYDLVFSNFGGLNCLSIQDLSVLSHKINSLLKIDGRFIAVVMPKFSLWETLYMAYKMKFELIFRRNTDQPVEVDLGQSNQTTWYYSPADFKEIFSRSFDLVHLSPIGITLPPSYMEPFFAQKPGLLSTLNRIENSLNKISILSWISDHFLVDFIKR
ncbi:MAG: methyltransferase domain-containing protein [Bacteroidales bacterium]|nr:methyltransferase domain-containing protein [Bacteroidales bacterium]MCF8405014.1 methyltransferase domain-containing protein [Bacteroidales bacterium]